LLEGDGNYWIVLRFDPLNVIARMGLALTLKRLYQGDRDGFLRYASESIRWCDAEWQPATFRDTLRSSLVDSGIQLPGLDECPQLLDRAVEKFQQRAQKARSGLA
jgi:hypothetical protein